VAIICERLLGFNGLMAFWGGLGIIVGAASAAFSNVLLKSRNVQLAPAMIDDFVVASEIHLQGRRTVYEPAAVAIEDTNSRGRDEFRMRVRVIEQTFNALYHYRKILNLKHHGMFAFQMISHKVMRYLIPLLLFVALVSNAILMGVLPIFVISFAAQLLFYIAALFGFAGDRIGLKLGLLGAPYYFVLINAAILTAFWKFMRGEAHVIWSPIREEYIPEGVSSAPNRS